MPFLRHAVSSDPDYALGHYNLGLMLKAEGKTGEARNEFEEAVRIRPGYTAALHELETGQ
jgi:Tfp pilus assembly protein PilF